MHRVLSSLRQISKPRALPLRSLVSTFSSVSGCPHSDADEPVTTSQYKEEPNGWGTEKGWGFLPLVPEQQLQDGRFRIVRKLGWGGHSTVWLAHEPLMERYVAIKALTAHATEANDKGQFEEIQLLERVHTANPNHPGYQHCHQVIESFRTSSQHGEHICLVTEALSADMDEFRMTFANRRIPVPLVKRFIKQTLFALDYLHRECGIIHSDLKPHNMMLALIDDHDVIVSELEVAPTEFSPAKHDNDPCNERKATVKSQPLLSSAIMADEIDVDIKLGDFGHANWVERHLRDEIQPIALRAPETVLGYPYSTPADIWSVGCLTFEYLSGVCLIPLRDPNTPDTVTILDTLLARILQTSSDSDYPTDMIDRSIDKDLFFTAEGLLRRARPGPKTDLTVVLRRFGLPEDEVLGAVQFIHRCIRVKPEDRPSAQELLEDPWLRCVL